MTRRSQSCVLGVTLLLVSCFSDSTIEVGGISSPLKASTTLTHAVTGRVQSPPTFSSTRSIGAPTTGALTVREDGATTYTVPIWVPSGVRELQPSLAVAYNSHAGTGLLGPRWTLSGLSEIRRCRKTVAQDGSAGPVTYTGTVDDIFCLDGERLVNINRGAPAPPQYQTTRNPFAIITADAGLTTFQVKQPDGRILFYGRTASSRLQGTATTIDNAGIPNAIYAYYLDKILDRFGNSILITYAKTGPVLPSQYPVPVPSLI
jgi:hypothetical protein